MKRTFYAIFIDGILWDLCFSLRAAEAAKASLSNYYSSSKITIEKVVKK